MIVVLGGAEVAVAFNERVNCFMRFAIVVVFYEAWQSFNGSSSIEHNKAIKDSDI